MAVTDPLQIVATGLPTVRACDAVAFIKDYVAHEEVEALIVGLPLDLKGNPSESERFISPFLKKLKEEMPDLKVIRHDERFTSSIAHRDMISAGFKKSQRQERGKADEMAAVLILNSYLDSKQFQKA